MPLVLKDLGFDPDNTFLSGTIVCSFKSLL